MGLGQVAIYHLALRMVLCMLRPLRSPIHIRCHEAFLSINLCVLYHALTCRSGFHSDIHRSSLPSLPTGVFPGAH